MDIFSIIIPVGVSILIGALIGLEREKAKQTAKGLSATGIRTEILVSVFGAVSAILGQTISPALFLICLGAMFTLNIASYIYLSFKHQRIGFTTEISTMLVFLLGALTVSGHMQLAIILGVLITLVLSLRTRLHQAVSQISTREIYDTIKFAIIAFIILPFLPNHNYDHQIFEYFFPGTPIPASFDQIQVLNPYNIWFLVVLVSGISFLGYILVKTIGNKKGISIAGLIGGLYSSTATSLSLAQKSKSHPEITTPFITGIVLACGISFVRTYVFVGALNRELLMRAFIPVSIMFVYLMAVGLYLLFKKKKEKTMTHKAELKTPFELTEALKLGGFITGTLLLAKIVLSYTGIDLYYFFASLMAFFAIDDPIIISAATSAGKIITMDQAKNALILVMFLNMFQKVFMVYFFGNRKLFRPMLKIYGGLFLVSLAGFLYF